MYTATVVYITRNFFNVFIVIDNNNNNYYYVILLYKCKRSNPVMNL